MKMQRTVVAMCLAAASIAAANAAIAQDGWYVGVTFGSSNATIDDSVVAVTGATASNLSRDERDPGFKVLVGYGINRYLAVEGAYAYLGEFRITRDVAAPTTGAVNADIRVIGFTIDAVGMVPIGTSFAAFGKVGTFLSETRTFRATSGTVTLPPGTGSNAVKDEFNLKLGIGIQYHLAKNVTLRAEWERFFGVGSPETGESDINLYSGGILLRF
jgi:OOP family OmpA-OmpF porin